MAKTKPTIPIATLSGGDPEFELTENDWLKIETAYGREISIGVREKIHAATLAFLYFVESEHSAEPISAARDRVLAVKNGASQFMQSLFEPPAQTGFDSKVYADGLIRRNFRDTRVKITPSSDIFHSLGGLMSSVIVACNRAVQVLDDPSHHGRQRGDGWKNWIRRLDAICDEERLPKTVRKDSDKSKANSQSPYVEFIGELQDRFPEPYRRSTQSKGALAQSIYECRDRPRREPIAAKKFSKKSRNRP